MKRIEIQTMIQLFRRELRTLEAIKIHCGNCDHFATGQCKKFQAVPPAEVQAVGCNEYEYDEIPF